MFVYTYVKSSDHSVDETFLELSDILRAMKTCAMNAKSSVILRPCLHNLPFSFHTGLGFCLHQNASLCIATVLLYAFPIHFAFCAAPKINWGPLEVIMRFHIELS